MEYRKHKHGGDIYSQEYRMDFSANINPLGTPKKVLQAAHTGVEMSAHYPDVTCRELKNRLEEKEGIEKKQLICGNGAADLIFSLAAAEQPKRALLAVPGFAEYEQALTACGCRITYHFLKEEEGFVLKEDYLDNITPELDILFLCVPNNPTGLVCSRDFLNKVLAKCIECQVRMVVDECFEDFLDNQELYTMKEYSKKHKELFILKAFTKTYAMAGLRLGYGISSDEALLERMELVTQPWNVSIPAQMAGVAALSETEFVKRSRSLIKNERLYLKAELTALGFQVFDSQANFIFFRGREDLALWCRNQGILIRDCANYRGLGAGYYRIAVRTHAENEALIHSLRQLPDKED